MIARVLMMLKKEILTVRIFDFKTCVASLILLDHYCRCEHASHTTASRGFLLSMPEDNLKRMITLAEEFFDVKNDPDQISVGEETRTRLRAIHPNTMTEVKNEDGPIAWVLVIPTTTDVMEQFLTKSINEQQILQRTSPGGRYEAVYLCSALVLPEHRGKGLAKRSAVQAVREIQKQHPIKQLFAWTFSLEGEGLAGSIAQELGLPLRIRGVD